MNTTTPKMKAITIGLVLLVFLVACDLRDPKQTYSIQYRVTGSARSADITISVPAGGTEQRPVSLPYTSPTYTFKGFEHAYISAQNKGEYGDVTTEILVNGSTHKRASSSGAYTIASVSWSVRSKQ
jgi:hypothetical protein